MIINNVWNLFGWVILLCLKETVLLHLSFKLQENYKSCQISCLSWQFMILPYMFIFFCWLTFPLKLVLVNHLIKSSSLYCYAVQFALLTNFFPPLVQVFKYALFLLGVITSVARSISNHLMQDMYSWPQKRITFLCI